MTVTDEEIKDFLGITEEYEEDEETMNETELEVITFKEFLSKFPEEYHDIASDMYKTAWENGYEIGFKDGYDYGVKDNEYFEFNSEDVDDDDFGISD